ncbi:MAG: hypothetical protein MZV63_46400 [Marinilabiliales bacterium]|nr:hypothetical protein [Marinilabiliales bacterium]
MGKRIRVILFIFLNHGKRHKGVLEIIKPVLENPGIMKIGQNMKFDIQVLANYGIEVKGQLVRYNDSPLSP